jgi:hypothetical protein
MSGSGFRLFLRTGEQVEQESAQPCLTQGTGHLLVSWAVPAAATAVGKYDQAYSILGQVEFSGERQTLNGDLNLSGRHSITLSATNMPVWEQGFQMVE